MEYDLEELKELYLRAVADYKNLKNRVAKERLDMASQIRNEILKKFIPVYDDIYKACMFKSKDKGLDFILKKFNSIFKEFNVETIPNLNGKTFNSDVAEAVSTQVTHVSITLDNMIADTVSSGLRDIETNEIILYPKVIVYKFVEMGTDA